MNNYVSTRPAMHCGSRRPMVALLALLLALIVMPTLSRAQNGDFNQDGKPDLLLQNRNTNDIYLIYLNGADYNSYAQYNTFVLQNALSGTPWKVVGTPDLNRDGYPDILLQNQDTKDVYVLYMYGADYTKYAQYNTYIFNGELKGTNWDVVGTPDMNHDGYPDLLLQDRSTKAIYIVYLIGTDYQTYQSYNKYIINNELNGTQWTVVGTPDQNRDGFPDILLQDQATNDIYILYMYYDDYSTYAQYNKYILQGGLENTGWKVVGTPDLNGDGYPDILIQNESTNDIYVLWMYGDDINQYAAYNTYITPQGALSGSSWLSASPIWNVLGL